MAFLPNIFGSKPDIVPYQPIDFGKSQIKALMANLAAGGQISQLGDWFEKYMVDAYSKLIPNFSQLLGLGGKSAQAILEGAIPLSRGEIPDDVKQQVYRSGAYQSLLAGTLGGPMGMALTARDLGLTSLNLMNQGANLAGAGANAAQRWAGL